MLDQIIRGVLLTGGRPPSFEDVDEQGKGILVDCTTLVGLEVEVEGVSRETRDGRLYYWRGSSDGSLHWAGAEFISSPVSGIHIINALSELEEHVSGQCTPTSEGSVHVHVDGGDLTVAQTISWMSWSLVLEDILCYIFCPERGYNAFCQRMSSSQDMADAAALFMLRLISGGRVPHGEARYLFTNYKSLLNLNTIEFRGMKSSHNAPILLQWVDALLAVRKYAVENVLDTPWAVHRVTKNWGVQDVLRIVLADVDLEGIDISDSDIMEMNTLLNFSTNLWRRTVMRRLDYVWEQLCAE